MFSASISFNIIKMFFKNIVLKRRYSLITIVLIFVIDYSGILVHLFELSYIRHFQYPITGDVLKYAHQIRFNLEVALKPINLYEFPYISTDSKKCSTEENLNPDLTFIVKSAMNNFHRRLSIRKTWGNEKRFYNVVIRTVFLLGISADNSLQDLIKMESEEYHDIVQADFIDSYYNNTIKTMTGFRWSVEFCSQSRFYMFVDDDFYVSTKNVLLYLQNPLIYPHRFFKGSNFSPTVDYQNIKIFKSLQMPNLTSLNWNRRLFKFENLNKSRKIDKKWNMKNDAKLYVGFVLKTAPHRHKWSKWYIPLKEYPFDMWPPYITAGAFILSREALHDMYFTSMYTTHFRFDDIFLSFVATKAKVDLKHCDYIYFEKASFSDPQSYRDVIASHGYDNSEEMVKIWTECNSAGYA